MVALGLSARPDLLALVHVTPADKKQELNAICNDATEAAAGSRGANMGNALHALTERVDAGETVIVPPSLQRDVDAYVAELARHSIEILPEYIERVCVNAKLDEPIAGTTDRIVRWQGALVVLDVKSAASMDFAWRKTAIQLSIYANADSLYDREAGTHTDMPPVTRATGIVMHLPAGKGVCKAYAVDLRAGWEGCGSVGCGASVAEASRPCDPVARRDVGRGMRLVFEVDPATRTPDDTPHNKVSVYESSVTHAGTGEPLVTIYSRGPGMRLTRAQATELRDWLTEWLA